MAHVSHWPFVVETQVSSQVSPHGMCGEKSYMGVCFYPSTSLVPSYHTMIGLYSIIPLSPTLYNLNNNSVNK